MLHPVIILIYIPSCHRKPQVLCASSNEQVHSVGKPAPPTNNGVACKTLEQNFKGRKLQKRTFKLKYHGEKDPPCAAILRLHAAAKKLASGALGLEVLLAFHLFGAETLYQSTSVECATLPTPHTFNPQSSE
jgi:hypothetical protein